MIECGMLKIRLLHLQWNPSNRDRSAWFNHETCNPYISKDNTQDSYIFTLRCLDTFASFQILASVVKTICAKPIRRESSECTRPSIESKLPKYLIDCLIGIGLPLESRKSMLSVLPRISHFASFNSRPNL